ncbi:RNA polymerase sigma factor [Fodinibius salsisoli]|uniref:Sigma-70 family RNA polymerase sigma factor n=1 Tax=Fodinibius salsisoli TaxID=2820877 RepID=A0ABT3PPQ1_9BACT|nr:sigma-70 family RNA polymerase sigma factor [Fodinibius salsisoli]MCW9707837.1 sigma-70 family RNA polymerase sigma factor [Fodinibius salsisoli]
MSSSRVDYSEFVYALKEGDQGTVNRLLKELTSRLRDYAKVVLGADKQEAEECTQRALIIVYEQILKDKIRNEKQIFSYLIKVCRNEYFWMKKDKWNKDTGTLEDIENYEQHLEDPGQQIENLQDEDRQKILEVCLNNLKKKSRAFIEHILENPDITTKEASEHFGISEANVRTKKSRILSRLHYCFQRKWNK